ncbi:TPA: hypothetical protein ACGO1T_000546 [Streptococcus suis]
MRKSVVFLGLLICIILAGCSQIGAKQGKVEDLDLTTDVVAGYEIERVYEYGYLQDNQLVKLYDKIIEDDGKLELFFTKFMEHIESEKDSWIENDISDNKPVLRIVGKVFSIYEEKPNLFSIDHTMKVKDRRKNILMGNDVNYMIIIGKYNGTKYAISFDESDEDLLVEKIVIIGDQIPGYEVK